MFSCSTVSSHPKYTKCRFGWGLFVHWCTCSLLPTIWWTGEWLYSEILWQKSKKESLKLGELSSQCPFHSAYLHANDCFNHLESEEWLLYSIMFKLDKSNDRNQSGRNIPNPQPWQNEQISFVVIHCKFLSISTKKYRQFRNARNKRSGIPQGRTHQPITQHQVISPQNTQNRDWAGCTYTFRNMHVCIDT